jgi:hypothetical protein
MSDRLIGMADGALSGGAVGLVIGFWLGVLVW